MTQKQFWIKNLSPDLPKLVTILIKKCTRLVLTTCFFFYYCWLVLNLFYLNIWVTNYSFFSESFKSCDLTTPHNCPVVSLHWTTKTRLFSIFYWYFNRNFSIFSPYHMIWWLSNPVHHIRAVFWFTALKADLALQEFDKRFREHRLTSHLSVLYTSQDRIK